MSIIGVRQGRILYDCMGYGTAVEGRCEYKSQGSRFCRSTYTARLER